MGSNPTSTTFRWADAQPEDRPAYPDTAPDEGASAGERAPIVVAEELVTVGPMPHNQGLAEVRRSEQRIARSEQRIARLRPHLIDAAPARRRRTPAMREPLASVVPLRRSRFASCRAYDIVTLDAGGRFYPRDAVQVLGWAPGQPLWLHIDGDRVLIRPAAPEVPSVGAHVVALDGRTRLRVPDALRQWLDLAPGSRVLTTTDASAGQVVLAAVAALDGLFETSHPSEDSS